MASFNRQRCHVAILFLLLSSAIGSPSGDLKTLRSQYLARKVESGTEANITSTTTLANPVEITTTETAYQTETSTLAYPTTTIQPSPDNPMPEMPQESQKSRNGEQKKQLNNIYRSGNKTNLPYQQDVSHTHRPGSKGNAPRESPPHGPNEATSTPTPVIAEADAEQSIGSEGNEIFRAEDLLTPLPRIAYFLAQLMSMSMQNLDTAFRGTVRNLSPVVQYTHSFRTTLLQISQKLNNFFLVSLTNADQIKMHSLFVPSKVKEVAGYLEKFENSSRIIEFIYLPLKNLKETSDQTLNLSSQIASEFGELVYLVNELTKFHTSSKSDKEQQLKITSADIQSRYVKKKEIEEEIVLIEHEIENWRKQKQRDEAEFNNTMDALKDLQDRQADKSGCYWTLSWARWIWYCPNQPDPSKFRQVNQSTGIAKSKLENTMNFLHAKEEVFRKKREEENQLLITAESLRHEMRQLNEDLQLLGNTSDPLNRLRKNNLKLDASWNKFVAICRDIQSGAKKNLEIIEEANRTSTHWSHSEKISLNLNKTKEDLLLVKTVIEIYLEESRENIVELFAEVEQKMTKRENPGELEQSLQDKCKKVIEEIKTLAGRNKGPIKTQTPKQFPKAKDSRPEKYV
ncbi:hypothetical protein DAPPUDRAFT_300342 [Daphnia pulex]|uniref:Uncharacterized protein n=1 Tax=Daphnia pulex TaxID=6669 RepID=E9G5A2_DAPPU|nr:hypothetical protein DAPPUDRAFT_300342 [Daphnia pulex]|eukprot:EFX85172.1 hypothetical protein DAPPUDRAFT_300342 [Daphnia pulex]